MISVRKVGKSYGTHRVLDEVSLEVARGEVVCVIGPSGSGKSILLRCINGLEHYDEGQIAIDGAAVHREHKSIHALRSEVGMVFQRFNLFPHRTALENVMEGPVHVKRVARGEARERAIALLAKVGLEQKLDAVASSSASPSPGRWRCSRRRSCSTSRRPRSTLSLWAMC